MYYLRVYFENNIIDVRVKEGKVYTFGPSGRCDIVYRDFPSEMAPIKFVVNNGYWEVLRANKKVDLHSLLRSQLEFNKVYIVSNIFEIAFAIYKLDDKDTKIYKINKTEIMIGSDKSCDVCIRDRYIAGKQIKLLRYGDQWYFEDLGTPNGTYVNGKILTHITLNDVDELVLGFSKVNIHHNILTIKYSGPVIFNLPNLNIERSVQSIDEEYPYYYKPSIRPKEDVPTEEIEIERGPGAGIKPRINLISVLLPPIGMSLIMASVCVITNMNPVSLFLTIPMLAIGAITSLLNYRSEKAKYQNNMRLRTKRLEDHLDAQLSRISKLANAQRKALNLDNPSTKYLMESVEAISGMWDRSLRDKDFMTLRLGSGKVKATFKINVPKQQLELEEDRYMTEIRQVAEECKYVNNVPVTLDLLSYHSVGIVGNKNVCDSLTKNLIYQAAGHHNYNDLKIFLICDKEDSDSYSFVRFLPHNYDDQRLMRFYADDKTTSTDLLDNIADIIEERESVKNSDGETFSPYYLIVSVSKKLTLNHAISRKLTQVKSGILIGTIFSYGNIQDLPNDCHYICEVSQNNCVMYEKDHASVKHNFVIDKVNNTDYEMFARKMLPIITDTENKSIELPKTITFMQGMKANDFLGLDVKDKWSNATPERSMAVPIGRDVNGADFYFDIHEKAMGPHGIVAGMTGSGKSEAVQTFMLSLGVNFPPEAVSFVIVDFKGTGLILPFKNMPHLAGTISDIDTNISRNLIALMTELERRKSLLDKHKVSNISNYLKLYREGKIDEPLSYLFIVIDEFAEFKKKFPDFMKAVSTIFRIGRTLGVHIMLLTQKPANVVDDEMKANTRFRWCLKVASSTDSSDMLQHPDAAKITNAGRAYIQVGEDEIFEQIQTYYSGARFKEGQSSNDIDNEIFVIDKYGHRLVYKDGATVTDGSYESEIDYVVKNLRQYAEANNYKFARKVWSEKLPNTIALSDIEKQRFIDGKYEKMDSVSFAPTIGLLDDPRAQLQVPLKLEFTENGSYTLYGSPGTGKTTLLNTLIYSTIINYTPDEVNMYIMDFGGGSLNVYEKAPHVGGIVLPDEGEKLAMLERMLEIELNKRKKIFAKEGLTNIKAYKKANPNEKMPYILLMIDNYAYAVQNYPEIPDFLLNYVRDGANYGMYFINAVSTVSAMNFRLAENIKNKITLYMTEKSDYAGIFSMAPGITIDNLKGHGIAKYGKYCVEYQTALPINDPDENNRVLAIRDIVNEVSKSWAGNKARNIPVLPEKVNYKDDENKTDQLLIGISKNEVEKVEIDIGDRPFILISNYRNDGFENMLYEQINYKYNIGTKLLYGNFEKVEPDYVFDREKAVENFENIIATLEERKKVSKDGKGLGDKEYPYILVYLKAYTEFLGDVDEKISDMLQSIVKLGRGLNVIVIVEDNGNRMGVLMGRDQVVMKINDIGTLLVLGGNLNDNHSFAQIDVSYSEKSATILNDEAYVVTKNSNGETEFKFVRTCVR